LVPAHVRDLQMTPVGGSHRLRSRKAHDLATQDAEPGDIAFLAMSEQHLLADAYAQERLAPRGVQYRLAESARIQFAHAVRHRTLSGKHDPRGGSDHRGICRHDDALLRGDMRDRLGNRTQVAHAIVDDGDIGHYRFTLMSSGTAARCPQSAPLVDGTAPAARSSRSAAIRKARPNALKIVSH